MAAGSFAQNVIDIGRAPSRFPFRHLPTLAALLVLLVGCFSSFYTVNPEAVAVVKGFSGWRASSCAMKAHAP